MADEQMNSSEPVSTTQIRPDRLELFLDESGSRLPDDPGRLVREDGMDCFALGGILVRRSEIGKIIEAYSIFCARWNINVPLHSTKIRTRTKEYAWIGKLTNSKKLEFFRDVERMIEAQPFVSIACVVHRTGYNRRYKEFYGDQRWLLCKTAYAIVVEHAAKFAMRKDMKLKVHFEEAGKRENADIMQYQKELKSVGMPFAIDRSSKYQPLSSDDFRLILEGDPKRHTKSNRLCQLADLVLYPIAKAKYVPDYRPYLHLKEFNRLIDCVLPPEEIPTSGIKYSCFDD